MENRYNQTRERLAYYWPTYGPPVLGALLVLLALFVGYRILSNRDEKASTPQVQDNNLSLNIEPTPGESQPPAEVTLPAGVTPAQTPVGGVASDTKGAMGSTGSPSATSSATSSAMTKGGKLPETGFPIVFAIPAFSALAFGGYKLSKAKK